MASALIQQFEGPPLLALLVSLLISSSLTVPGNVPVLLLVSLISLSSPALWFVPELSQ